MGGEKNKGGRPNKYFTHVQPHLTLIAAWTRNGLTLEDIGNKLGVSVASLCNYQNEYIELFESLKVNRELADTEVENALYKRAMGYEYDEITYENGVETKRVRKAVVPDTTAQIFWLKNRKPTEWRDKQQTELTGAEGGPLQVTFNIPRPKR